MIAPKLKKQFSLDGVIMKVIHLPPPPHGLSHFTKHRWVKLKTA